MAFACLGAASGVGATRAEAAQQSGKASAVRWLGAQIRVYQAQTWQWQRLMGMPRTETEGRVLTEMSIPDIQKAVALWRHRAAAARRRAQHPPHLAQWLCIHRYEGSWHDAGAPYYGGLQMDLGFQARYGGWLLRLKGTADRWTPVEQMWVAEKARRAHGFYPWPNTARYCGLI